MTFKNQPIYKWRARHKNGFDVAVWKNGDKFAIQIRKFFMRGENRIPTTNFFPSELPALIKQLEIILDHIRAIDPSAVRDERERRAPEPPDFNPDTY